MQQSQEQLLYSNSTRNEVKQQNMRMKKYELAMEHIRNDNLESLGSG